MRHASSLLFLGIATFGCGDDSADPQSGPGGSLTAPVPMNPAGCSSPSVSPGDNPTLQIQHEGQTRNYILYVPKGIDPKTPTPMVVNWHGLTSNAIQEQGWPAMRSPTKERPSSRIRTASGIREGNRSTAECVAVKSAPHRTTPTTWVSVERSSPTSPRSSASTGAGCSPPG